MGKINRLQLRGISRTPSDRMNSDGGIAESLNMYIDEAENAPALLPEDVRSELGLPIEDYDVLFIHKGVGYTNPICKKDGQVGVWKNEEGKWSIDAFLTLAEGEEIRDITALGNSVVISTTRSLYYVLRKTEGYKYLGTSIPLPAVQLYDQAPEKKEEINQSVQLLTQNNISPDPYQLFLNWNEYKEDEDGNKYNFSSQVQDLVRMAWGTLQSCRRWAKQKSAFSTPIMAKYAIRLKTGEYIDSDPYLIGGGLLGGVRGTGKATRDANGYWTSTLKLQANCCYNLAARLYNADAFKKLLEDWTDVVESLDVFVSTDIFPDHTSYDDMVTTGNEKLPPRYNYAYANTISSVDGSGVVTEYNSDIRFGDFSEDVYEEILLSKSNFYLAESFKLVGDDSRVDEEVLGKLASSVIVDTEEIMDNTMRVEKEAVPFTYRSRHQVNANKITTFNARVLLADVETTIPAGPYFLSGKKRNDSLDPQRQSSDASSYRFKFYVKGESESLTKSGESAFGSGFPVSEIITGDSYTWLTYPDSRCYKVAIEKTTAGGQVYCKTFDMKPHPFLPIAYLYLGAETAYGTAVADAKEDINFNEDNPSEKESSKIYVSSAQNPFMFPTEGRYTVSAGGVMNVAIAATALSEGQFGQFPLYVFAKDGIWAMETAADGSFLTCKPLSREVCANADSITPIDSAVVFVTDKGVMLLQGAQVVNISPHMNGRHYTLEEAAKVVVEGQEGFKDLIPVVTDNTHFMAFVKKATIGYDYTGKRLIFLAPDESYQYIYKIDSQTWHKTTYGYELETFINSYPDCYVQGQGEFVSSCYVSIQRGAGQLDQFKAVMQEMLPQLASTEVEAMWHGASMTVKAVLDETLRDLRRAVNAIGCDITISNKTYGSRAAVYNLSTPLDIESQMSVKGIIATRPFDLGAPDVLKTITDIKVRGNYTRGAVKFMLLGSMDGINFYVIGTKRGKAWKLFRLIILADLLPTERISWVDVEYEEKFVNRLR